MAYKYPRQLNRKFFVELATTYIVGEVNGLLTVGMEFPELGMVKIEAEHPVPGVDRLVTILEE